MDVFNLVLRFRMAGETEYHTTGAARIRVDGRGLMVYNCDNQGQNIDVAQLSALSILPVNRPAPLPVSVH